MKIEIQRKQLVDVLNSVGKIANSKAVVPITQNVKIIIRKDGTMVIMACDMELSAMRKFKIAESFDTTYEFCINPRDLGNAIKTLRDEFITLDVNESSCVITYSKGRMTLPVFEASLFPTMEMDKDATKVSISAELLFGWLKQAMPFASDEDLRPMMKGVHLYVKNGELGVCATDTRSLYADNIKVNELSDIDVNATLSTKAVAPLLDLINGEENVTVYFGEKKLSFRTTETMLLCTKPVGNFPDFKRIIRKESPIKVTIDKNDLIDSISRAILVSDTNTSLVKLTADENIVAIDAEYLEFSKNSHEEVSCECIGDKITIGVQGTRLIECLKAVTAEKVSLDLATPQTAINIFDESNPTKNIIIMPTCFN